MQLDQIVTLAISFVALALSVWTHISVLRRDRKQATLEAYNHLEESVLEALDKMAPSEIKEAVKHKRSAEYKMVMSYVARIEHFCVGINHKIYDFYVAYDLSHGFLDGRIYERVKIVIDEKGDYYTNTRSVVERMLKKESA